MPGLRPPPERRNKSSHPDLVDSRRRTRILIAILVSAFGIYLAMTQFAGEGFRGAWLFSLVNAALIFLSILTLSRHLLASTARLVTLRTGTDTDVQSTVAVCDVPPEFRPLKQKLDEFMASGGYRQSNLSITVLAEQLSCPEHRLRRLIASPILHML